MRITHSKFLKYFYTSILVLWWIITLHIFYVYILDVSEKKPTRWWTFVHWTFSSPAYLPYLSDDWEDRFFQSLIFNWCMSPYVEWTNVEFEEDLCNVETNDYRDFKVSVKDGKYRSDWTPVTNEDIYFTYNNIIKENKRSINYLNTFANIDVNKEEDWVAVSFPNWSADNKIFFSEFILPKHILEWEENFWQYIESYWPDPIGTNCASIEQWTSDPNSIVFNMSECEDSYVRFYQAKRFNDIEEFKNYQQSSDIVDLYIHNENIDWFRNNKVILNNFISIFFNIDSESINWNIRRAIGNEVNSNIYTWDYDKYFIKDRFLFETDISWNDLYETLSSFEENLSESQEVEIEMPSLWNTINQENFTWQYYLDNIDERYELNFEFDRTFDEVSVQVDDWASYTLQWYDWWDTARYNISPDFNNISVWENNYIVRWDWETIYEFTVHYQDRPTEEIAWSEEELEIKIIYYENEINNYIKERLEEIFENNWVRDYFSFEGFESSERFQWQIQSKNYDITIRSINMWLKKDISNMFTTNNPEINPSWYVNNEMASNINQYFRNEWSTAENLLNSIHSTYSSEIPFLILWKQYWNMNIKDSLDVTYPERLYDYWFMKDHINEVKISYRPEIDSEEILNWENFVEFISSNIND